MDLATQIGALIGTSMMLYWVTKPRDECQDASKSIGNPPPALTGARRYSSYHRKKHYASMSLSSSFSASSEDSVSSSVSSDSS
jgi:hypothetical protein